MALSIEEIQFLDLIPLNPLNPISVKNSKYDRLICLIIPDIVAFWTEAWKSTASEINKKKSNFDHFWGGQGRLKKIKNFLN